MRKQRASLALATVGGKKTIFFAAGTVQETGGGSAGWILAYDIASNTIAAALALSSSFGWRLRCGGLDGGGRSVGGR